MKKYSTSKENPLKYYITGWLKLNGIFLTQNQYLDDIYQLLFVELFKIDDDKFITTFFNSKGELNINKLCATACLMLKRKAFYKLYRIEKKSGEELLVVNHAYLTKFLHGSIFFPGNSCVSQIERYDDDMVDGEGVILYDDESEDNFFDKYNFVPEDILKHLTLDERDLFIRNTGKSFNEKNTTQIMLALADKIKAIKKKIDNDRKRII